MADKRIYEIIGVIRASDRMTVIKVLVQIFLVSVITVYAPLCGLDESQ